jgi:hypothetical protein
LQHQHLFWSVPRETDNISVDELLRPKNAKPVSKQPSRKVLRRLESIEDLPAHQQQTVLKTIDTMLKGLKPAS